MRDKYFLIILLLLVSLSACRDENVGLPEEENMEIASSEDFVKGVIRIKLTKELGEIIDVSLNEGAIATRVKTLDDVISALGATSMTRTFPPAGKFEARTRADGLHLWYDVKFAQDMPVTRAMKDFSTIVGLEVVEPIHKIVRTNVVPVIPMATMPFSDPLLAKQWHYSNDGAVVIPSTRGADINLFNAWKITKGNKKVIVSVVDGGIDYMHEDLAANMWVNTAEKEGTRNMDDDRNGFMDDIYGFNFAANTGVISASEHGTHVAGTVGAVNGNDKGVCGIAGGSGDGDGVRLMSCQIFRDDEEESGSGAQAIKYGADNGAVISQNSWGYKTSTSVSGSDKAAIDYFIKHAGIDENGKQVGPMKGGVVIFAAGNENREIGVPGSYEPVIAVASMAADFKKAYYSNYGDWVDITAPGGDLNYSQGQVYSTLPGNKYGYMQGTSMACPHVSGVAALIVSKFGGSGFTPEKLKEKLLGTAKNIDRYNGVMYAGKLGRGYMDAAAALGGTVSVGIAPDAVKQLTAVAEGNSVTVEWKVTADRDDDKASGYTIYYANHTIGSLTADDVKTKEVAVGSLAVGAAISGKITALDFDTKYYFVVVGYDADDNKSRNSPEATATTGSNRAPIITPLGDTVVTLKTHENKTIQFKVDEPDNDTYTFSLNDPAGAAEATLADNVISISISGIKAQAGTHNAVLTVADVHDVKTSSNITYTILPNLAPSVIQEVESVSFSSIGKSVSLDLSLYFSDPDGETLSYEVTSSLPGSVTANIEGNILSVTARGAGESKITVTATDAAGESCSISFMCMSRDGASEVDLYPNPVVDVLNIRMGEEVNGDVHVTLYNSFGVKVMDTNVAVTPFSPGQLNVKKLSGGSYTIVVGHNGKEVKRNIVKL